jgi:hypothetical protein
VKPLTEQVREYQQAVIEPQNVAMRAALRDPRMHHTRFRMWCGKGQVYAYFRDETSPTGVMLAASCSDEYFAPMLAELRAEGRSYLSPLSPTEGR